MKIFALTLVAFGALFAFQGIPFPGPGRASTVASCSLSYTTGLKVWYKADVGLTCTSGCSGTNAVTAWADQSGNANNLTFVNSGSYLASAVNGLPGVTFDGTNDYATIGTPLNFNDGDFSFFAIAKATGSAGVYFFVSSNNGGPGWALPGGTSEQQLDSVGTFNLFNGTAAKDTNYHQMNVTMAGATITGRLDRAADGSNANGTTFSQSVDQVGGITGGFFNGVLVELLAYDASVTGGNLTTLESYLNCRSGL